MAATAMFFSGLDYGSDIARPIVVVVFTVKRFADELKRLVVVAPAERDRLDLTHVAFGYTDRR